MEMQDTIAAIASGHTPSGIGIIRISGPDAVGTAGRLFRPKKGSRSLAETESARMRYGDVVFEGEVLDEALFTVFRAPNSYTGEDVAEINCHGGIGVMQKILRAVLCSGARAAEPGEFTKRAFLSGRMDLSQAEAVMDLIEAGSRMAERNAVRQLGGGVRDRVKAMKARLLAEIAFVEAALDDPEHYDLTGYEEVLPARLADVHTMIREFLSTVSEGRILRDGITAALIGRPNAGKSTLLNALTGKDAAIVTDIPGTTRDVLSEELSVGGIPVRLLDTAGIRSGGDTVEAIGVARAKEAAREADLLLFLLDTSVLPDENDRECASFADPAKTVVLLTKGDLPAVIGPEDVKKAFPHLRDCPSLSVSAAEGRGLAALSDLITERFLAGRTGFDEEVVITNERQAELLRKAEDALLAAETAAKGGFPADVYVLDLTDAAHALGQITGEDAGEEIIEEIFSKFCMGK